MTTILFQPTFRPHLKNGTVMSTMPYSTNPGIGYVWVRAGLRVYALRARFDGKGRIVATAPDGTGWDAEGWTEAHSRVPA